MSTTIRKTKSVIRGIGLFVFLSLSVLPASANNVPETANFQLPDATKARLQQAFLRAPLTFEANRGQTDSQVKFLARGSGYSLFLTPTEAVLAHRRPDKSAEGGSPKGLDKIERLKKSPVEASVQNSQLQSVVRMKLKGANPDPKLVGVEELPGKVNYFIGNDPEKWRTNVPTYAKVEYRDLYPGVDVVYYGNQRQLEYDFVVSPGTDPSVIQLAFDGIDRIDVDSQGDLILHTALGELKMHKPLVYQEVAGVRKKVAAAYVLYSGSELSALNSQLPKSNSTAVGFQVASYDLTKTLIIDPVLAYSTYLGGNGDDFGLGIAVDSSGNAYITGSTQSTNFPTANALQATGAGWVNVFVTKLNANGSAIVYSTYLGGNCCDQGDDIAVDSSGNAYVMGTASSTDFPTVNAFQATSGGSRDAFVTKLNSSGSAIVYSTYLDGNDNEFGGGIAVDSSGNAYITGETQSTNFPTANALQATYGGGVADAFVTKLNANGSAIAYSTYLGGSDFDQGGRIAVDSSGNAYITGRTGSTNFPTANALQATSGGGADAFVTKLNANGSAIVYSTYLGGNGFDQGSGIAVDSSGNAYITGYTRSTNFPTANAIQATPGGGIEDAFVTKLNANGSAIAYSTYLGGNGDDEGIRIALDSSGNAYITGYTGSTNFPTANAIQATSGGFDDAFVTKLNANGSAIAYSTYLGGTGDDAGFGIAVDSSGNAYITGITGSTNFPTANAIQATSGGFDDAFVTRIDATPPAATCNATLPFRWPTASNASQVTQDYAEFNGSDASRRAQKVCNPTTGVCQMLIVPHYHTGMDLASPTYGVPQQVFAVAKGEVVAVCPNGVAAGCVFGNTVFSTNGSNHEFQGVVILKHTVAGSGISYSLYGHLDTVENFLPGQCIEQSTLIGATGGLPDAHLHFEMKSAPVLHNPDVVTGTCIDPGTQSPSDLCWGYTLVNPNARGYHDPVEYLHLLDKAGFPKAVTLSDPKDKKKTKKINARSGPGAFVDAYPVVGKAEEGSYTALSNVPGATADPICTGGWYQIRRASNDCSVTGNCFAHNDASTKSSVPEAWVCGDFVQE